MSITRLTRFAVLFLLLAAGSFGAQPDLRDSPHRSQPSKAATQRGTAILAVGTGGTPVPRHLRGPRRICGIVEQSAQRRPEATFSASTVVNRSISAYEEHTPTASSAISVQASFDLPSYITELERWSALASRMADHPEQAVALRRQLPDSWSVVVEEQHFSISTRPMGAAIDGIIRDPGKAAEAAQVISRRIESLLEDARAISRTSARDYSPERAKLDQILKRHEFRFVREGARSETFWDQILDRLWQWVTGLLDRAGNHPKVTNFLRWGIVMVLGLVLLAWLAYSLAHVSPRRFPAPAGELRAAPARDWVKEAQNAAARGEYRDAIRILYGAAVLALGEAGAWQVDPSRTHREYVRLLPRDSLRRPHLMALTDCFERVWYGRAQASALDYEAALADLESLR